MKFKFTGEQDVPMWCLSGLHALGQLPANVSKALVQHITDEMPEDGIMEVLKDTKLQSREECARATATVRWVVGRARANACPGPQLARDLQLAGAPRGLAAALADAADARRAAYEADATRHGISLNRVVDVQGAEAPEGAIDALKLSFVTEEPVSGETCKSDVLIGKGMAKALLEDLEKALSKMTDYESQCDKA